MPALSSIWVGSPLQPGAVPSLAPELGMGMGMGITALRLDAGLARGCSLCPL